VHEEGFQVERLPDGQLEFRRPDCRVLPAVPPASGLSTDPERALRARNDAEGLVLNARTAIPLWVGERLNVVYAIDVLHPRATGELRVG